MIVRQRNSGIARVHIIPRRRGIGDAAASDAFRGNAPSGGNIPWPTWSADDSWKSDPAGQALLTMFPGGVIVDSQTMYADGWASSFNQVASAALGGRVAPNQTQLGISKAQTGCSYDMQLTIGQYWAALKAYNAGTWQPPASQCGGPQNPAYGPQSSTLYPNIYISPTWTASDTPTGVTDADVQAQYKANEAAAVAAAQLIAPAASGSQPTGTLTFVNPRSNGVLYPGDPWTIKIQGAAPNSPVAVTGNSSPATFGTNITTPMGTTDSAGNWSISGAIDSSQIGKWFENWSVGGHSVGSFSFTVAATPVAAGDTPAAGTPAGTSDSSVSDWFSAEMISGIPNWALLAAGGVVAFLAFGGRKR
jgi:hypothetical protein